MVGSGIAEDEFVVKEEVENHGNGGGEAENAGGFDKIVVEGNMKAGTDVVGEFVEWGEEAKEPSK